MKFQKSVILLLILLSGCATNPVIQDLPPTLYLEGKKFEAECYEQTESGCKIWLMSDEQVQMIGRNQNALKLRLTRIYQSFGRDDAYIVEQVDGE